MAVSRQVTLKNGRTTAIGDGGAIYSNTGAVTINRSTLSGNPTAGTDADGGGLWVDDAVVTIVNSTITGNSAARAGGGLGMLVMAMFSPVATKPTGTSAPSTMS